MRALLYTVLALGVSLVAAIPIDNGVEGEPEIECGPTSITVNFNTRNPFEGHVFVKGLYDQPGCRSDEAGTRVAGISLPFDTCNVRRTRSLEPRGVFVQATVIITFHPKFITKVDRAYTVQCFYMEADKTVSTELEVSMLTTAFQTQVVPMPICRYEILDGPDGQVVRYAIVGQSVYHKWTCDTETVDTFCMVVHSCYVDDGAGDRVDLLDDNGCALDRYLLRNLEYLTDLMAGQETHVFKYADRAQLFFECQITITIKEPGSTCPLPQCSEPERGRRSVITQDRMGTMDVLASIDSFELEDKPQISDNSSPRRLPHHNYPAYHLSTPSSDFCLSPTSFSLILAAIIGVFVVASVVTVLLCQQRSKE